MSDVSAVEKINRLLRLGRSPNQHEAAAALAKAAQLALKHQIDLAAIKEDEEREAIAHEWFPSRAAYNMVEMAAAQVVIGVFPVDAVYKHGSLAFIGVPSAITSAKWALAYLIECAGRELKKWRAARRKSDQRPSRTAERTWLEGWKFGIVRKAGEERAATPELTDAKAALVLADQATARSQYAKDHLDSRDRRKARQPNCQDTQAFLSGVRAGMDIQLSQPIEEHRPAQPALL